MNTSTALPTLFFDYNRQAWVKDGVYVSCGHNALVGCSCYGRIHAGEAFFHHDTTNV